MSAPRSFVVRLEQVPATLLLGVAIVVEVVGSACLKASDGLREPAWLLGTAAGYGLAFALLALVVRRLGIGFAYAVWAGVGTALTAAVGVLVFGEALSASLVVGAGLVVGGVVLLNRDGAAGG